MNKLARVFCRLGVVILLLSCCLGIAGCGRQEEPEGLRDIWKETEQVSYGVDEVDTSDMIEYTYLGSQYWQGERIQIWGERQKAGGSVYIHREDGSRELLAEDVDGLIMGRGSWWIDSEKNIFIGNGTRLLRIGSDGGEIFNNEIDVNIDGICQLEDGRYIVLTHKDGIYKLEELDPDSGGMEEFTEIQLSNNMAIYMIIAEGNGALLLCQDGIRDVDLAEGKISSRISFEGTSYTVKPNDYLSGLEKEDFRILEDGRVELLWSDGTVEYLQSGQVDEEKQILTLRIPYPDSWMKEQVVKFNQTNKNYYVVIEENSEGDSQSFTEQTALELGVGKGADIICNNAVGDEYSLLEKGVFEDLTPYMEAAGIREEDYFPAAFSAWKYEGKIYGVNYMAEIQGMCVSEAIAEAEGPFDGGDLAERLLVYDKDAVLFQYGTSWDVLYILLKDSESLCGMVDLESGTCDFGGETFGKLLETAKRYCYEESREEWEVLAEGRLYYTFYCFNDSSYLSRHGKVSVGYPFDEGGRTEMKDNLLAINVNSPNKEGAWEFISFMLGDEVQLDFYTSETAPTNGKGGYPGSFPVSRSAFEKLCERQLDDFNSDGHFSPLTDNGKEIIVTGLTEERKEELRTALEEARSAPFRTKPLLEIILEEAESYFSGMKSIDEVRDIVENRVKLFLDERN